MIIMNLISIHVFIESSTFPFYREGTEVVAHNLLARKEGFELRFLRDLLLWCAISCHLKYLVHFSLF